MDAFYSYLVLNKNLGIDFLDKFFYNCSSIIAIISTGQNCSSVQQFQRGADEIVSETANKLFKTSLDVGQMAEHSCGITTVVNSWGPPKFRKLPSFSYKAFCKHRNSFRRAHSKMCKSTKLTHNIFDNEKQIQK